MVAGGGSVTLSICSSMTLVVQHQLWVAEQGLELPGFWYLKKNVYCETVLHEVVKNKESICVKSTKKSMDLENLGKISKNLSKIRVPQNFWTKFKTLYLQGL